MKTIIISDEIRTACPDFVGAAVYATFINSEHSEGLWKEINEFMRLLEIANNNLMDN